MRTRFVIAIIVSMAAFPAAAQMGNGDVYSRIAQADANNDGAVSRPEFLAWRASQFERLDRNDDNVISESDFGRLLRFQRAVAVLQETRGQFDRNRDGRVTRAEFVSGPTTAFNEADTNNDNHLTRAEIESAAAAARARFNR